MFIKALLRPGALLLPLVLLAGPAGARELPDFTVLAEELSPAVVNIATTGPSRSGPGGMPPGMQIPDIPEDSPLHDFFEKFFGQAPDFRGDGAPASSLGSGFIVSEDGYVVSNNHVVADAEEVIVRLSDRREFVAEVVGVDERSDIAVLKIDADNLPTVRIGDSAKLKVGEWVLAIGSPFGFDHSVTAGIVSAKGRSLPSENYTPFIQTDVAINPGNSGGPLFDMDGRVVGVNSQIYSRTGGFMGLSFAIPVDVVMNVYSQLRDTGSVSRGWLGVLIQDVTRELAESFGMSKPHGALVSRVLPDSPAAAAGLQPGDVVVTLDGREVDRSSDLPPLVGNTAVGDTVEVELFRAGERRTLEVTLGELPAQQALQVGGRGPAPSSSSERLGLVVKPLSREEREALEIEAEGVLVEQVEQGAAAKAGLQAGDVLLMIDNQPVTDIARFDELVAGLPAGKSVPVLIQRRGGPMFLALKVPGGQD